MNGAAGDKIHCARCGVWLHSNCLEPHVKRPPCSENEGLLRGESRREIANFQHAEDNSRHGELGTDSAGRQREEACSGNAGHQHCGRPEEAKWRSWCRKRAGGRNRRMYSTFAQVVL